MLIGIGQVKVRLRQLRVEFNGTLMFAYGFRHSIGLAITDPQEIMDVSVFQPECYCFLQMGRGRGVVLLPKQRQAQCSCPGEKLGWMAIAF